MENIFIVTGFIVLYSILIITWLLVIIWGLLVLIYGIWNTREMNTLKTYYDIYKKLDDRKRSNLYDEMSELYSKYLPPQKN